MFNICINKKGQALVELAILLPILLLILMGIFEFGRVFNAYLIINHASREGARVAAVGNDDGEISQTIHDAIFYLEPSNLSISISPSKNYRKRGDSVEINIGYDIEIIMPIIQAIIPSPLHLEAKTIMRVE